MKSIGAFLVASFVALSLVAAPEEVEDRWVFLPCTFWGHDDAKPHSFAFFTNTVQRAKNAGYNGVLLTSHMDVMPNWVPHLSNQVVRAKAFCDEIGIEVIPMVWDVGYGGDCPGNWFESRPADDLEYVSDGKVARFDPQHVRVDGLTTNLQTFVGEEGKSMPMRPSVRFTLKKGTRYLLSVRLRSTGVPEKDKPQFIGFVPGRKSSAYSFAPAFASDGAWHEIVLPLEGVSDDEVTLVFGHWGRVGKLEVENFRVTPRGICEATRRERIPFVVKDAKSGRVYEEGRDYDEVPGVSKYRGEGPLTGPWLELTLPRGSRIRRGARLLVSAEIPYLYPHRKQYSACMSNPDWYRRAAKAARAIEEMLHPKKWFLCFDELAVANTCAACRSRNLDMAHLIGDCLRRQREIVRKVNPDAVCYVWGDMLDPNHNANEGYAHTVGSYEGIAKCIPQDLVICPWWGEKALVQADYWSANGFRMVAGAYYDDKSHKHDKLWLEASKKHPDKFTGFMFCTWRNDFSELENFAKLMFGGK